MKLVLRNLFTNFNRFNRGMSETNLKRGMTLIEIMIVMALIGSLIAVLAVNLSGTAEKAKIDQTRLGFNSVQQGLQMFKIHVGRYPTTDQGLKSLVTNPGDNKSWRGPYLEEKTLKDPWGNDLNYESDGRNFKIQSAGPDGTMGNDDDLFFPEQTKTEGGQ